MNTLVAALEKKSNGVPQQEIFVAAARQAAQQALDAPGMRAKLRGEVILARQHVFPLPLHVFLSESMNGRAAQPAEELLRALFLSDEHGATADLALHLAIVAALGYRDGVPVGTFVDIGSGTGALLAGVAEAGANTYGLEYDAALAAGSRHSLQAAALLIGAAPLSDEGAMMRLGRASNQVHTGDALAWDGATDAAFAPLLAEGVDALNVGFAVRAAQVRAVWTALLRVGGLLGAPICTGAIERVDMGGPGDCFKCEVVFTIFEKQADGTLARVGVLRGADGEPLAGVKFIIPEPLVTEAEQYAATQRAAQAEAEEAARQQAASRRQPTNTYDMMFQRKS